jgi:hypothetical protein
MAKSLFCRKLNAADVYETAVVQNKAQCGTLNRLCHVIIIDVHYYWFDSWRWLGQCRGNDCQIGTGMHGIDSLLLMCRFCCLTVALVKRLQMDGSRFSSKRSFALYAHVVVVVDVVFVVVVVVDVVVFVDVVVYGCDSFDCCVDRDPSNPKLGGPSCTGWKRLGELSSDPVLFKVPTHTSLSLSPPLPYYL